MFCRKNVFIAFFSIIFKVCVIQYISWCSQILYFGEDGQYIQGMCNTIVL